MSLEIVNTLPTLTILLAEIQADMGGNVDVYFIVAAMAIMLTIHGVMVLSIAGAFHAMDRFLKQIRYLTGASFISYFAAILMIILTHIIEILAWTYILLDFNVFPTITQTFYFVGEMYTTVGFGSYTLSTSWQILPILISFSGIFAVSMSGAALYSMMGSLLTRKSDLPGSSA